MDKPKKIIPAIDRDLIEAELTDKFFIRKTSKGGNDIYIIDHKCAPNTLMEIGRLREITFRQAGGGTGKEMDLDDADTHQSHYYRQLIVYNPNDREIIGGYRFIKALDAWDEVTARYRLSTTRYFTFSEQMQQEYLPYSIELGRSWVQPQYQPSMNHKKGIFSLLNVWDGLGALARIYPGIRYFFGKATIYSHYNESARNLLLSFLEHYFPAKAGLCKPRPTLTFSIDSTEFNHHFTDHTPFKQGLVTLTKLLKNYGESIPPLINIYMNLSTTMMTFGTAENPDFGNVKETALIIPLDDIRNEIRERHIDY